MDRTRGAPNAQRASGSRLLRMRLGAALATIAILPLVGTLALAPPPAVASSITSYPTWKDVQAAQKSEARARALVAKIRGLVKTLNADVAAAEADAQKKGDAYGEAQDAYDAQELIAQDLSSQAKAAQKKADGANLEARRFVVAQAKLGGGDLTANMLMDSQNADSLLDRLGMVGQLGQSSAQIYAKALQLQNTAGALAKQAKVATDKLAELKATAEAAFKVAQAAADVAQTKVEAATKQLAQLNAQLTVLIQKRKATVKDYNAGLRALWGSGAAGEVSASGWARPAAGYISSNFGMRFHPIYHIWKLHTGVDLAGAGCGAPIYAAHQGVVVYAGWNGDLGNFIQIDHQNGTSSGYGHIVNGGILVHMGQEVGPGQQIARIGSTGGSTGCHLHFIIRINGNLTDPVPFMRARGITLG